MTQPGRRTCTMQIHASAFRVEVKGKDVPFVSFYNLSADDLLAISLRAQTLARRLNLLDTTQQP